MSPHLIIVTGPPGAGKTTLGRRLAADLGLPFLYKDGIKEALYPALPATDIAQSMRLGRASYDVLFHVVEALLAAKLSTVIESNFRAGSESERRFLHVQEAHAFTPIQVFCWARPDVLVRRYRERAEAGERSPVHFDFGRIADPEAAEGLIRAHQPLEIDGALLHIDCTCFGADLYPRVLAAVRGAMQSGLDGECLVSGTGAVGASDVQT